MAMCTGPPYFQSGCVRPRNLSRGSGSSILTGWGPYLSCFQKASWAPAGPERRRSSTYTVSNSLDSGTQNVEGWLGTGCPPMARIALVRCRYQCPPDSGCPYRALRSIHIGRRYLPCQCSGQNSLGIPAQVSCLDFKSDWTYARIASA